MSVTAHEALKLNTSKTEQLLFLEKHFLARRGMIAQWFKDQWAQTPPPFYGSIDLRNAGFKLAPIDMNLFPAGFNNLNPDFLSHAINAARQSMHMIASVAHRILLLPESHTRNLFYWENVNILKTILEQAGFVVRLGALNGDHPGHFEITLQSGVKLQMEQLIRQDNRLSVAHFEPDVILLNNDLSDGIPESLQGLNQLVVPPAELGWSQRLKSDHFQYYAETAAEFAEAASIDPWLVSPLFRHCGEIDFMQQQGMECLIHNAEVLMEAITQKYAEYHIGHQPFLVVKADAGTYGMAVMTVRNIDELRNMNRKQRTRMATIKGGQPVRRVIIQEGVYTFETYGPSQAVAEPVIYMFGQSVIGGFYRVHQDKGTDENLNSPGMRFEPIAFAKPCDQPCDDLDPDACPNRFYVYGLIAQLSMLAAAREIRDQRKSS